MATKKYINLIEIDSGFEEINIGYNDGLRVQEDSSGVSDWSYISLSELKRCDFRQLNIICTDSTDNVSAYRTDSPGAAFCQLNCHYRGYKNGICFSAPGPGAQPSGEWQQSRGDHYCYCSYCHNDQCMQYCHGFGLVTGYCHEPATFGTGCRCVGCGQSECAKHCHDMYGNALKQSLCRHNECRCLANACDH